MAIFTNKIISARFIDTANTTIEILYKENDVTIPYNLRVDFTDEVFNDLLSEIPLEDIEKNTKHQTKAKIKAFNDAVAARVNQLWLIESEKIKEAYEEVDRYAEEQKRKAYIEADQYAKEEKRKAYEEVDRYAEEEKRKAYEEVDRYVEEEKSKAYKEADRYAEQEISKAYVAVDQYAEKAYAEVDQYTEEEKQKAYEELERYIEEEKRKAYEEAAEYTESEKRKAYEEADRYAEAEKRKAYAEVDQYAEAEKRKAYAEVDQYAEAEKNKKREESQTEFLNLRKQLQSKFNMEGYQPNKELTAGELMEVITSKNDDADFVFRLKVSILEDPIVAKSKDKKLKLSIRKSKNIFDLFKNYSDAKKSS